MQFAFILALIISILISIFAIQNGDIVTIDFFFVAIEVSQAVVILVSTVIGAVIAAILGGIRQIKKSAGMKELKNKIKTMEAENSDMHKSIASYENDIQMLTNEKNALIAELESMKSFGNQNAASETILPAVITDTQAAADQGTIDSAYLNSNNEECSTENK